MAVLLVGNHYHAVDREFFLLPFDVFICLLLMNLVYISSGPGNVLTAIGKNKR